MPRLINQGEEQDEFGITYERLANAETGKVYRAYPWPNLQLRRAHIADLEVLGQQPGYEILAEHADREVATQRQ